MDVKTIFVVLLAALLLKEKAAHGATVQRLVECDGYTRVLEEEAGKAYLKRAGR